MSFPAVQTALQSNVRPALAKWVLVALVSYQNRRTGLCCPSMESIARRAGLSEAMARRYMHRLERELRVVSVKRNRLGGGGGAPHYAVDWQRLEGLPEGCNYAEGRGGTRVAKNPSDPCKFDVLRVAVLQPKPSITSSTSPSGRSSTAVNRSEEESQPTGKSQGRRDTIEQRKMKDDIARSKGLRA